jgi:hypothetical protein
MAVLTSEQRAEAKDLFINRWIIALAQTAELDSTEIQALIDDEDTWLEANQVSANNAIRASIRSKARTQTKFAALAIVALKRAGLI